MPHALLIVEDNDDAREMYATFLEGEGFRVAQARDGVEALDALASERPALVILDLWMPRMSGLTVLRRIRADPKLADLPVVVLSAQVGALPLDERRVVACAKPCEPDALLQIVKAALAA